MTEKKPKAKSAPKPEATITLAVPPKNAVPEGMFGTKEAARRLKIEPRVLRVWLRSWRSRMATYVVSRGGSERPAGPA